jgi:hypothetical protein
MQDTARLWQAVLGEIELTVSRGNFVTWFKNRAIISINIILVCLITECVLGLVRAKLLNEIT